MARIALTSSVIKSTDYDPVTQILTLELQSGKVYRYAGVPLYRFQELVTAKSAGQYYGKYIRGQYKAPKEDA
jgi:KTSC domain